MDISVISSYSPLSFLESYFFKIPQKRTSSRVKFMNKIYWEAKIDEKVKEIKINLNVKYLRCYITLYNQNYCRLLCQKTTRSGELLFVYLTIEEREMIQSFLKRTCPYILVQISAEDGLNGSCGK